MRSVVFDECLQLLKGSIERCSLLLAPSWLTDRRRACKCHAHHHINKKVHWPNIITIMISKNDRLPEIAHVVDSLSLLDIVLWKRHFSFNQRLHVEYVSADEHFLASRSDGYICDLLCGVFLHNYFVQLGMYGHDWACRVYYRCSCVFVYKTRKRYVQEEYEN